MAETRRRGAWAYGAGLAACGILIWLGLIGSRVPLLALVDLGFHELGHLVAAPFPDVATALAGSVVQVAVPLGLSIYFLVSQRDLLGVGLCLGWAGTSSRNVAVYIADAPLQALPLIGGQHDWAYILSGGSDVAAPLAGFVTFLAWAMALASLGACGVGLASATSRGEPARRSPI